MLRVHRLAAAIDMIAAGTSAPITIAAKATEAADLYQQVAKAWSRYGHRLEEAQALLGAGRCQARLEQPAEALLVKARDILIELRAQPLLDETERQLRSLRR